MRFLALRYSDINLGLAGASWDVTTHHASCTDRSMLPAAYRGNGLHSGDVSFIYAMRERVN